MGCVSGGGTLTGEDGETERCDIEIEVEAVSPKITASIIELLDQLGAPKGSTLRVSMLRRIKLGSCEGLALYQSSRLEHRDSGAGSLSVRMPGGDSCRSRDASSSHRLHGSMR